MNAEPAEANTKTMYLKEQSFSYMYPSQKADYIMGVYGKGEAVRTTDSITVRMDGRRQTFYLTKHFGKTVYISSEVLTSQKPKWTYNAKSCDRMLQIEGDTVLHLQPTFGSRTFDASDTVVYAIGETNYWYKVFREGKAGFIRKTDKGIKKVTAAVYPKIIFDGIKEKDRTGISNRIRYLYCMLPQEARKQLTEKDILITVCRKLPNHEFDDADASGYACSDGNIYLKERVEEGPPYAVESSLVHEFGHLLHYGYEESMQECFEEKKTLGLRDYYSSDREYLAETFDYYVKVPEYLKKYAPKTYAMYEARFGEREGYNGY